LNLSLATERSFQGDSFFVHAPGATSTLLYVAAYPPRQGLGGYTILTPCRLSSPCGSPGRRREDTSHRLLQPTHDTSTRRPFDSRASSFRWTVRLLPRIRFRAAMRRRTALRLSDLEWTRLTTWSNFGQITHAPASREGPSTAPGDVTLPRRYQPRARLCDSTSGALSQTPSRCGNPNPVKP
jgi:hypothetical protein